MAAVVVGSFEPFGADWSNASGANIELRLPGQWANEAWEQSSLGAEVYYNVARFYEHQSGRYTRVDPAVNYRVSQFAFSYADSRPTLLADPLGLLPTQFVPHRNQEVQKICGSYTALGCAEPHFWIDCRCDCDGSGWRMVPVLKGNGPVLIHYSTDCYDPELIKREEMRHADEYDRSIGRTRKRRDEFRREQYGSEESCKAGCTEWVDFAKKTMYDRLRHWWIDFTHPRRNCLGRRIY